MSSSQGSKLLRWITATEAPAATVLIRLAVGSVFLSARLLSRRKDG